MIFFTFALKLSVFFFLFFLKKTEISNYFQEHFQHKKNRRSMADNNSLENKFSSSCTQTKGSNLKKNKDTSTKQVASDTTLYDLECLEDH